MVQRVSLHPEVISQLATMLIELRDTRYYIVMLDAFWLDLTLWMVHIRANHAFAYAKLAEVTYNPAICSLFANCAIVPHVMILLINEQRPDCTTLLWSVIVQFARD
jgi:hypothetical protein